MLITKKILLGSQNFLFLSQLNKINPSRLLLPSQRQVSRSFLIHSQKLQFTSSANKVPPPDSVSKEADLTEIKEKIESMYDQLISNQQIKELERIIYPEALLHGQQNVSKLTKLHDLMIIRIEKKPQIQRKDVEQLIKAGDFYRKMHVRRLKALKPYQRAKQAIESNKFYMTEQGQRIYRQVCNKINSLIQQDIEKGQCQKVQQYYREGLKLQKSGNQLQSLYYYYKGICISEYKGFPDKLLHFNLLAHYLFLSELMRPKCHELKEEERFNESIQKYNEVEELAHKWWREEFSASKDLEKRRAFEQTEAWVHSNKGDIYFRARKYNEAIKCYERVINFYKQSKNEDERIKIVKLIQNLEKSYQHVGLEDKAITFLQWAHEFVKDQTKENVILKSRYLKPIDEMLMKIYQKGVESKQEQNYGDKINSIEEELKKIVS